MAVYQILYWKDIPAQVKVSAPGERTLSRPLDLRFQEAIDRLAMQEGLTGTDDYLNHWHWGPRQERPGTPAQVMEEVIRELEGDSRWLPDFPKPPDSTRA